jgi:hypothetical protein
MLVPWMTECYNLYRLNETNPADRANAIEALAAGGSPRVVSHLIRIMDCKTPENREVVDFIEVFSSPGAVEKTWYEMTPISLAIYRIWRRMMSSPMGRRSIFKIISDACELDPHSERSTILLGIRSALESPDPEIVAIPYGLVGQ